MDSQYSVGIFCCLVLVKNLQIVILLLKIPIFRLSLQTVRLGGGIGRHAGLKIPWPAMAVRVRVPSEAR